MFSEMQNPFASAPPPAKKAKGLSASAMQSIEDGKPDAEAVKYLKSAPPSRFEMMEANSAQNRTIVALGERVKRLEDTLQAEQDAAEDDLVDAIDEFLGDR